MFVCGRRRTHRARTPAGAWSSRSAPATFDRVLAAAKPVHDLGELDLVDAAQICALLTLHDDPRASRAGARLAARITLALGLDLETLDVVVDLVAHVTDPSRLNELRGYCDRAEARTVG